MRIVKLIVPIILFLITAMGLFLELGDFGIAELFLLSLKWLLKQRHHQEIVT